MGVAKYSQNVDIRRIDGKLVAAGVGDDQRRIAQGPAQPGDLRLKGVAAGRGPAPQIVDHAVRVHESSGVERQADEHFRSLATWNRQELAITPDLDGTKHRDL